MSRTSLFKAARAWDAVETERLLEIDRDLAKATDRSGRTALHLCAGAPLRERAGRARASLTTARALLAAGAELDAVQPIADHDEIFPATPLWYAVARGCNPPLVEMFLELGANPDHCLWATAWANDAALTRSLLQAGARTDLRADGETPLLYAARLGREPVIEALLAAGADVHIGDGKGRTAYELARKKRVATSILAMLDPASRTG